MRLRPYISKKDYNYLEKWVDDERLHGLWCANRIPYPLSEEGLGEALARDAEQREGCPFVAVNDAGIPLGFFCYSINHAENSGFLCYVILDREQRGTGLGGQMLRLALRYAFEITGVSLVRLSVFDVNEKARKCYARTGFVEKGITENAFSCKDEQWGRCQLEISADAFRKGAV